ncbi:hypothetical protein [Flavilitoribacter nigricans]|uniref:Uncharacterized protein n=1 Tax=Flavilitoribacter nigricans (strain ATCC 23147 / DSM 23189 / NBRC 102662 / NCIMB 1420 / SS-2) TaxID=1122177 RepID=A0A2D0N660_FLAN2|nr:hypothetical protein [Flavilitoribacter nigricans]PHN03878.1 hypothetical protein CRP01_23675 [Flavilitoribacter nigricans DSM 23189 = NBRC 102662]
MTYIAGFKNKDSVFIVGDSSITYLNKRTFKRKRTTIGQKVIELSGQFTHEECLKIYNIENKLILGFAGQVEVALNFIQTL